MSNAITRTPGTGFGDINPSYPNHQLKAWFEEEKGSGYYAEGFEVFHCPRHYKLEEESGPLAEGWYWWGCQPGCLPDSDPIGPFPNAAEAARDAKKALDDVSEVLKVL